MVTALDRDCFICKGGVKVSVDSIGGDFYRVKCGNCGTYRIAGSAAAGLERLENYATEARAQIAFAVRRQPADSMVNTAFLQTAREVPLPHAAEMLDNLLLHLAANIQPGEAMDLHHRDLRAPIGARSEGAARWAAEELLSARLIKAVSMAVPEKFLKEAYLTTSGWSRHAELMRAGAGSRLAFMAMKFNDPELDNVYATCLKPAVELAGFELRKVSDSPAAGLIDNRMRVQIRTSRFLVCDLTHGNKGAYWEAGFAEGLGRPVIYLCREDVFHAKGSPDRPHFDTDHQTMILWDPAKLDLAASELTAMIRATLPAEAKME